MCQLSHIVGLIELGRIDLVDLVGINFALLLELSALAGHSFCGVELLHHHRRSAQGAVLLLILPEPDHAQTPSQDPEATHICCPRNRSHLLARESDPPPALAPRS